MSSQNFCDETVKNFDRNQLARPVYVIQEHHAKKIHWDLRFEMDDTLKSWALPKAPPQREGERRLAVQVEDHPIEYALFEGTIPAGTYGAGKVRTWDRGTFEILEKSREKIVVEIKGDRLRGRYCLLHFKPNERSWLFFKMKKA